MEGVFEGSGNASRVLFANAGLLCDFVRGEETNASDVAGEAIGVGFDDRYRHVAVVSIDAVGEGGANAVRLEKDHDAAYGFVFSPCFDDGFASSRADARDFAEAFGKFVEYGDGFITELVDDFLREASADAFDEVGCEEPNESFFGAG